MAAGAFFVDARVLGESRQKHWQQNIHCSFAAEAYILFDPLTIAHVSPLLSSHLHLLFMLSSHLHNIRAILYVCLMRVHFMCVSSFK